MKFFPERHHLHWIEDLTNFKPQISEERAEAEHICGLPIRFSPGCLGRDPIGKRAIALDDAEEHPPSAQGVKKAPVCLVRFSVDFASAGQSISYFAPHYARAGK